MTSFVGTEPFQQDVPVLLDGLAEENSVQHQLDLIESLGGSAKFRAFGPIHHPSQGPNDLWVFGGEPEFGEVIRDNDTTLFRQALTLKLMEFVSPNLAGQKKEPKIGVGRGVALTYTTVQGDTLIKIAHKVYGDWKRWKEIGQKNGISDPHRILPAGRTLKL
jgi:nucleoid-associated protein YgaU